MEFICSKEEIQKSLSTAESIVSAKTTLSILANILLETKDNSLEIASTDLEVGFKGTIPADIVASGSITIQAKKFSEIIKSFSNCNLKFKLDSQNRMMVSAEDSKIKANFKILGIPKDDYPDIPQFIEENVFTISQPLFRDLIKKTIYSASTDEARYFLNGIYFEKRGENLNLVATDGKRLAFISTSLESPDLEDFDVIIPIKVLNELVKVLTNDGNCRISLTDSKVFFQANETEMVSNLLEGQFPNYNQVIPEESTNIMILNNNKLTEAIKRVSHMVDPKLTQIRCELTENLLTLYGHHPELGEAKDEVAAQYQGDPLTIGFNYSYLLDALKEIEQKEIEFKMTINDKPVIVKGLEEDSYLSVVMPMKLAEEGE